MNDTINTISNGISQSTNKDYSDIFSYLLPDIRNTINDRYRLDKEIGRGGFGVVFKGFDLVLKKNVALKFLSPKVTSNERKFLRVRREVNISQKISDEKLVKIFSLEQYEGKNGSLYFIVMEYLQGKTLSEIIKEKGKYEWEEFKPIFLEILEGIKILHQNNIIHRDLKPSNIIVKDGKIKILDFGLSKEMDDTEKTSSIGELVGSPQYMSPEQVTEPAIDFRSDIYQLGLILYRALTGNLPFVSESNTMDMIFKRINEEPKSLRNAGIKAPKFLEYGLTKSLEKSPLKRFASIKDMENYFKKEQYPVFGRTIRLIKQKPILISSLTIFLILSAFFYLKFSNILTDMDYVKYSDDTIKAYNKIGTKLFERKFEGKKIIFAKKQRIIDGKVDYIKTLKTKDTISVFTTEKKDKFFESFQSFTDSQNKNNLIYLSKDNKINYIDNYITKSTYHLSKLYYDFANIYFMHGFKTITFNKKSSKDIHFILSHSYYMFPSAVFIVSKGQTDYFFNPGPLYLRSNKIENGNKKLLLTGTNNIFSHLNFIIELNQNIIINNTKNSIKSFNGKFAIPNLSENSFNAFRGFFVLIPRYSMIVDNKWFSDEGFISFKNSIEKDAKITIHRNYKITYKTETGVKEYNDSYLTLYKVYDLVNKYYKEKLLKKDYKKALLYIKNSLTIPIQNIWLKSALLYFKGDLLIRLERYKEGKFALKQSLSLYPKNTDSFQRLTEISFLKGNIDNAIDIISKADNDMSYFWGLVKIGKNLFEIYCYLQDGHLLKVKDKIEYSKKIYNNRVSSLIPIISAISDIFTGNYEEALEKTDKIRGQSPMPFTLIEYRLVFARAVLLNSIFENSHKKSVNYEKLLKLSKFYIKDIAVNSISSDHLAKISRAYFLALDGQKREAGIMAKEGFEEVLKMSKGDFFTRFWLFYDAFIYGKTMKIVGNKIEAIRGFKECIRVNHHTDLSKRAKILIKSLKNK